MEDQDSFLCRISANAMFRFSLIRREEELLNSSGRINVDSTRNMSTVVLVVKAAVDNKIFGDFGTILSIQ